MHCFPTGPMKRMDSLQRVTEKLLLTTGGSRAVLQLARADGTFLIEAEAVQHGAEQLRHNPAASTALDAATLAALARDREILLAPDGAAPGTAMQILAPLTTGERLAGTISLHSVIARPWTEQDKSMMRAAQAAFGEILAGREEAAGCEDLRSAATQTILNRLRIALDVQRCTFRQPVQEAFAFPVTFESRAEGVRSLLGDFTIVQTGQPVIVKLLAERAQVVQEDCPVASADPLFHKMLAHYGGMRAQVVTPYIAGDQLKGVLSVHELRAPRAWTSTEKRLAAEAAALIGTMFETSPAN